MTDPYTTEARLCDDRGLISDEPVDMVSAAPGVHPHCRPLRAAAERLRDMAAARDYIDYPTGWALQADPRLREHHPKCSAAQSAGAFLCDCGAVQDLWCRLRDELGMGVPERIREYAAKYATPSPTGNPGGET